MKRSVQVVLGASALALTAAAPALAQESKQGPYVGLGGIYVMPQDSDTEEAPGTTFDGDVEWDEGWGALGSLGYAWGNGLRTELEFSWRQNQADAIGGTDLGGEVKTMAGMVNVLYDIDFGLPFKPYVGAGAGAARVAFDDVTAGATTIDEGELGFAWQGIAGASYSLGANTDLTLDYRYFSVPEVELETGGSTFDTEYNTHNVVLGVRFTFGAPPPPPAVEQPVAQPAPEPAPEPVQPSDYLVFFEFDSANLTPEAQQVLNQAAATAQDGQPTMVNVTGHADRSGPSDYNMRLSMRRAETVANYLTAQGVPQRDMAIEAEGETQPLVPTADGVREPQNRRVMIRVQ
ncbi:OmpA family protein [Caenispirillum salinarum]|uniref:OmpA family protein n=1 Tax=Caenispirillum salinarum TaxID=859058 RepID=UPI00384F88F7